MPNDLLYVQLRFIKTWTEVDQPSISLKLCVDSESLAERRLQSSAGSLASTAEPHLFMGMSSINIVKVPVCPSFFSGINHPSNTHQLSKL